MNIIAHGIDVVEEIGKGRLNHVRLAVVLVGKWVHHHLDSFFFQVNINLCTRHHRVAIIMDYAWLTAGDMELLAAERLDLRVLVQRLVEHVETYLRRLDYIEWFHDDNIHQTVAHGCLRGNIGIVAILRCVGTGNEERLILLGARLVLQRVSLRLILQSLAQDIFSISDRTTLAALGKLHADESVKAHAAGAEERVVVDDTIIQISNLALVDDLYAFLQVHWEQQMSCQSVARTARQNAEGCIGVNQ